MFLRWVSLSYMLLQSIAAIFASVLLYIVFHTATLHPTSQVELMSATFDPIVGDTPQRWRAALEALPPVGSRLPSIFLAHGSPLLLWPEKYPITFGDMAMIGGPKGPHAEFLKDFAKFILDKYKPKALLVFSAHWETRNQIEVMSYEKNHLLYDYGGFPPEMYKIKWDSVGSAAVANRAAELLNKNNISCRTITSGRGLDHGVFIPFKLMFPDPFPIPLVEISIDRGLDPQRHIDIGRALEPMRDEGVLIIAGGLTIHSFDEMEAWNPRAAEEGFKDFERNIVKSIDTHPNGTERNEALKALTKHPYFRRAHPREEHFVPIYVAAGAGTSGGAKTICTLHSAISAVFGI